MSKLCKKIYGSILAHPLFVLFLGCCVFMLISSNVWADASADYVKHCSKEAIDKEYADSGCWSCYVILMLLKSMASAVNQIADPILSLSKTVLILGAAIWYSVYFLKAMGSMATQDPTKIIDGALVFGFKVALVYFLLKLGIEEIVRMIVNPLLSIGTDIGTTFSELARN